jgi:hypothetical protein
MFALNKPALLTAGQILNQQCHAAALEAVRLHTAPAAKAATAPAVEDLINASISDLVTAAKAHRSGDPVLHGIGGEVRRPLADKLASAVTHIFHLAATNQIDLGEAIAARLADDTCPV